MEIVRILTDEFQLKREQVEKTLELIDAGNTIPFIARYRKEVTGSLDDTILRRLFERLQYLRNLEKRKEEIRNAILAQECMTAEIEAALEKAETITEAEDIYRPFKQHRKTRASVARARGLQPLAGLLLEQKASYEMPLKELAAAYVDSEKEVNSPEDALAGACDIIAEDISDDADVRKEIRILTHTHALLVTKQAKNEDSVYRMYYDRSEPVKSIPGHRILAVHRGEKEGYLKISLEISRDIIFNTLFSRIQTSSVSPAAPYISRAILDGYERLLAPSIEREILSDLFDKACEGAIVLFSKNLKQLLMQPPLKGKTVLGWDPGFRTGCKLAVVDKTGKVLQTAVIYPTKPKERTEEAKAVLKQIIARYSVDVIAIGNGTASAESEKFVSKLIREAELEVKYIIVSEAGASVYSASEAAAEEFPDFDVTERSAVSIARRLQDPLAELVKIDPKSIGVGQYQHDMKPSRLDEALGGVVESCVNAVGVDVNTASCALLSYIAGVNVAAAKNIVKYREENGEFRKRSELKKVPKIGAKTFEQCAGFLRIAESDEMLDRTGVHPESYKTANALLNTLGYPSGVLPENIRKKAEAYGIDRLCGELEAGKPTLLDILSELEKPGRDIRDTLPPPILRENILEIDDLNPGMLLEGTVRNVIDFGVFVDIGVHQDGLLHISQISDKFIRHPSEVLSVGDRIRVRVLDVDKAHKRIALTLKGI